MRGCGCEWGVEVWCAVQHVVLGKRGAGLGIALLASALIGCMHWWKITLVESHPGVLWRLVGLRAEDVKALDR